MLPLASLDLAETPWTPPVVGDLTGPPGHGAAAVLVAAVLVVLDNGASLDWILSAASPADLRGEVRKRVDTGVQCETVPDSAEGAVVASLSPARCRWCFRCSPARSTSGENAIQRGFRDLPASYASSVEPSRKGPS